MIFLKVKNFVLIAVAALFVTACAEEPSESSRDNELMLLNSTQKVYYPNATPLGGYTDGSLWLISHKQVGTGDTPQVGNYVAFEYTGRLLPISRYRIFQTTIADTAKKVNNFSYETHFAPMFTCDSTTLQVSLFEALKGMRVGDTVTVMSASWLAYGASTASNVNGETSLPANTPLIFTIVLKELTADPKKREADMVQHYVDSVNTLRPGTFVQAVDSLGDPYVGFFINYTDTVPLDSGKYYASEGDTISIRFEEHYLQDNFLYSTNIDSVAKLYKWSSISADTSYYFIFSENLSTLTLDVKAINIAVSQVAPGSWVEFVFTSDYAYGKAGSSSSTVRPVYAYTPMRFRVYVAKIGHYE